MTFPTCPNKMVRQWGEKISMAAAVAPEATVKSKETRRLQRRTSDLRLLQGREKKAHRLARC